jgi:hypothetical protein
MSEKNKPLHDELPVEFSSLEEAGDFWDSHSTADFAEVFEAVDAVIELPPRRSRRVALASDLSLKLYDIARQQGVSTETLVNLWLQEKLAQFVE